MKRLLALIIALGSMGVVMAQSGRFPSRQQNSRDVILGQSNRNTNDSRYGNHNYTERTRQMKVNQVRQFYNQKIRVVQRNRFIRTGEKRRQIRSLERRRDMEIRKINEDYRRNQKKYRRY